MQYEIHTMTQPSQQSTLPISSQDVRITDIIFYDENHLILVHSGSELFLHIIERHRSLFQTFREDPTHQDRLAAAIRAGFAQHDPPFRFLLLRNQSEWAATTIAQAHAATKNALHTAGPIQYPTSTVEQTPMLPPGTTQASPSCGSRGDLPPQEVQGGGSTRLKDVEADDEQSAAPDDEFMSRLLNDPLTEVEEDWLRWSSSSFDFDKDSLFDE